MRKAEKLIALIFAAAAGTLAALKNYCDIVRRGFIQIVIVADIKAVNGVEITLSLVVLFGVNIPALAGSIISEVRYKVEDSTGVKVKSVDIYVDSLSKD